MKITIYSTTTCSFCHALMSWLDKNNTKYTERITDTDPAALAEFFEVNDGMLGVPFTVIEDEDGKLTKIIGYDQAKFKHALSL